MKIFFSNTTDTLVSVVQTGTTGTAIDTRTAGSYALVSTVTVDTNAAKTFATGAIGTNQITLTAHGYKTGIVGQFTTTGALPTGLSTSTNYYTNVIDANTVAFYDTQAHALAGGATGLKTFTATGASGTGTFTPTALSGASVVGQWSNDQTNWITDGSAQNITTAASLGIKNDRPQYAYYRLYYAITAGSLTISNVYVVNKDS